MIDELLDLSRIATGKLRLDARPLNILPVVEAAIETYRLAAEAKGL